MSDDDKRPRAATLSDALPLAGEMADAFYDDPIFSWLMPSASQRRHRLTRFFGLELRSVVIPTGRAWTTDARAGASLELSPRKWKLPIRTQFAHGREFIGIFRERLTLASALITVMEKRHLREPHYYIPYVGIAPAAQGRGLGTILLRQTLDRCDRERLPAYLEATNKRNVELYERLGFAHLGQFRFAGSPPLWPMRRSPNEASSLFSSCISH